MNTIRTLGMDAVQRANSGHAGKPMALAPVVYCLSLHDRPALLTIYRVDPMPQFTRVPFALPRVVSGHGPLQQVRGFA